MFVPRPPYRRYTPTFSSARATASNFDWSLVKKVAALYALHVVAVARPSFFPANSMLVNNSNSFTKLIPFAAHERGWPRTTRGFRIVHRRGYSLSIANHPLCDRVDRRGVRAQPVALRALPFLSFSFLVATLVHLLRICNFLFARDVPCRSDGFFLFL